jgi:hypothetical protein
MIYVMSPPSVTHVKAPVMPLFCTPNAHSPQSTRRLSLAVDASGEVGIWVVEISHDGLTAAHSRRTASGLILKGDIPTVPDAWENDAGVVGVQRTFSFPCSHGHGGAGIVRLQFTKSTSVPALVGSRGPPPFCRPFCFQCFDRACDNIVNSNGTSVTPIQAVGASWGREFVVRALSMAQIVVAVLSFALRRSDVVQVTVSTGSGFVHGIGIEILPLGSTTLQRDLESMTHGAIPEADHTAGMALP